jgi:hypothetical protein
MAVLAPGYTSANPVTTYVIAIESLVYAPVTVVVQVVTHLDVVTGGVGTALSSSDARVYALFAEVRITAVTSRAYPGLALAIGGSWIAVVVFAITNLISQGING